VVAKTTQLFEQGTLLQVISSNRLQKEKLGESEK